ncbi:MAG: histidine triad nucleotide-binding protein [Proteobacteria bacterium]|nr:histidine triad nucleotide-binding protein [Pseudomonadota bacterium]MBU1389568.1 histidine triad nucleotide-binding protein [Pseudomonadota bacterium]MBU1544432.1 histidine triad nucleotide-binding protein [Pseudomonadota bacterium]MBU2430732.1 histidine triad nucleotide-binding protein [Pseudomonadota bacterium]MBU2480706.1 histidine triad nucleotide-binding protein [Pseudomonadota bacterium]
MSENCLFCKIIHKEIPSEFLHEDDICVVFRDINPEAPVHLLVVPRKHVRSMNDIQKEDRDIISHLFLVAKHMAKEQGVNESGYKLLFNVEKGGGQMIFHIHLHLIGGWKK